MDGKQQAPQEKKNCQEKACLRPESHLQKPDGCAECCSKNWSHVVQVSLLQELPSNERKRHKALRIGKGCLIGFLFLFWEWKALQGALNITVENPLVNLFFIVCNLSFIAVGSWYIADKVAEWIADVWYN